MDLKEKYMFLRGISLDKGKINIKLIDYMSVHELMGRMACYRYARLMRQRIQCITLTVPIHCSEVGDVRQSSTYEDVHQ